MINKFVSKWFLLATTTILGQPPSKLSCFTNMLEIKYCNGRPLSKTASKCQSRVSIITPDALQQIWIVIGIERGFCGDINDVLVQYLNVSAPMEGTLLLAVGSRLATKLHKDACIAAFVKSHSVVAEVQTTLLSLVVVLNKMQQLEPERIACIEALYDDESGQITLRQLLPLAVPKLKPAYAHPHPHPPLLNLEPEQVLSHLIDQYLYATLHEVFYSSLMVENHMRL